MQLGTGKRIIFSASEYEQKIVQIKIADYPAEPKCEVADAG
jgi:hypothetical protein